MFKKQYNIKENVEDQFNSFVKEYYGDDFEPEVNPDSKNDAAIYKTNFIIWYGTKGKSVIAPIEMFDSTEGNIYVNGKVDRLVELIKNSDEPIELETAYCIPYKLDVVMMSEILGSNRREEYEYEYINKKVTTGNSDLDDYISYFNDVDDTMKIFEYIDHEYIPIMDKYHMRIALGSSTVQEFKAELVSFVRNNGLDVSEAREFYEYVITTEHELFEAIKENQGDLNTIRLQLRDGNHRYQACKKLGMSYYMSDLAIANTNLTIEEISDYYEVR